MSIKVFYRVIAFLFLFVGQGFSQSYNFEEISQKVTSFNNAGTYDDTIILLEEIINNKQATAYDKYQAYYLKYITYKRLFSYDKAELNLNLALQEGLKSDIYRKEIIAKVKFEKLFIVFDLLKFAEVDKLLQEISSEDLKYIPANTQSFYLAVLAVVESKKKNFEKALEHLDNAIDILEKERPVDLPLMYRKKIDIYRQMNQYDKALNSFDQGLYYAKKYNMDIYILNMYYDLAYFYNQIKDYENAVITQEMCNLLAKEYDERTTIGRLNVLETKLHNERISQEKKNHLISVIVMVVICIIVIIIFFLLYRYILESKKKKECLRVENEQLRASIMSFISKSNIQEDNDELLQLTGRQSEIIELVKEGKTNKEIGEILYISENTVKYHLKNIYKVLNVNSRENL